MKVKTSIVIIFTLLIGIILGMFIDRTIMRFRFQKRFAEVRQARGITRIFERIIEPNESQYPSVREILARYSKRLHDLREQSHQDMTVVIDSLKAELDSILTDAQKARLKREMEQMKEWRERGPGPMPPYRRPFDKERERPPEREFK